MALETMQFEFELFNQVDSVPPLQTTSAPSIAIGSVEQV